MYITKDWLRQQVTLCCHPYDERHKSVNLAKWLMVRNVVFTNLMVGIANIRILLATSLNTGEWFRLSRSRLQICVFILYV